MATAIDTKAIDTKKVTGRRKLHFDTLDDILADAEQLAKAKEIRQLGNWSAGQTFEHLALTLNGSVDGTLPTLPWVVRSVVRLFMKRKFLTETMSPGFKLPKKAAHLVPGPTSLEKGLADLRQAIARAKRASRRGLNPVLGPLTDDEWKQLDCRHAELHLSFLVPVN